MKIFSKIKTGLFFKRYEYLTPELVESLKKDIYYYKDNNVFQTINWIITTENNLNKNKINLIVGFFEEKISYILPIQTLFDISDFLYCYINPVFSDYTQPYFSKSINPKSFKEYQGLIEESMKTFKNPKILFLRNQNNIDDFFDFKKSFIQFKFTNSYFVDSYKVNLKNSFKKKIKYYNNRLLREFNDYKYENHSFSDLNNNPQFLKDIEEIIHLKNKQYHRTKSNKKIDSKLWVNFSKNSSKDTYLFISIIKINSKIASGVICLIFNNIIYYLLPAYDINYKKYSIGIHHLNNLINFSKEQGLKGIDLTIGNEPYKLKFFTDKKVLYSGLYTNTYFLKPFLYLLMIFYKLINIKLLKFIFKHIKKYIKN
tara:strand:+ start:1180 stop:2289 length:1110 start_codon:yes stop_codon:yes gene_type:complete